MRLEFTKMHGLGNDFVVIDGTRQAVRLDEATLRHLADRHFGIGCDQILLVEPPGDPAQALFRYRIFNADGSEVEQCGNGARCFARFVREQGLTEAREIPVETLGGRIVLHVEDDERVRVNMGAPVFAPERIPLRAEREAPAYTLEIEGHPITLGAVSMGNPHALILVDDVARAPVTEIGPLIERHESFPRRVNVGFAHVRDRGHIDLRVFERGAGETLACGSGAAAAMAILRHRGLVDADVEVSLPGGALVLSWSGQAEAPVWLTGPATTVFNGWIDL
ncbi:diaminopimelate epimerase [Thioalkalivibrio sp. ALJ16]|uniref:diaminopimelate epimerase n=1 Tax=Thioalkalivibrio sp. ALJ16 TaxID=1158762 RepID=UPI00036AAB1F|nr:diaminopimelate epimerase [Thioalkalivibrio sp. ALJ16]